MTGDAPLLIPGLLLAVLLISLRRRRRPMLTLDLTGSASHRYPAAGL